MENMYIAILSFYNYFWIKYKLWNNLTFSKKLRYIMIARHNFMDEVLEREF